MKKLFTCMILMTLSLISIAQNNPEKTNKQQLLEKIEAQRSAYITSKLDMTSDESTKFWPLYNEYSRKRMELKKEYKAQNADNLSEQESRMELDEQIESQEKALALKKSYYEKFKAVLPAAKLAKLESAEQEFRREILRQIKERNKSNSGPHR
ncbi:MAG: hypothetical protein IPQ10_05175 [Saprospiraceae bacterium]|nr:hypothetical protein [Saprospiraceae bacterium]MBK7796168.1 hypothetical protein [Saprospiraceae bacterium]MBL0260449.1 hypothetical protein [Saprospiraceae bacterium]